MYDYLKDFATPRSQPQGRTTPDDVTDAVREIQDLAADLDLLQDNHAMFVAHMAKALGEMEVKIDEQAATIKRLEATLHGMSMTIPPGIVN